MPAAFDFTLRLGPVSLSPHLIFETLAYIAGFALYNHQRKRHGDFLADPHRSSLIVATILGAALGSKLLAWFENPVLTMQHWNDLPYLLGGKTIVGAFLGGTLAVEWTKARLGITRRTGDLFTIPIIVGTAIGRLGCFFAGLADHTYGIATTLPWGVDFGDGIARHPTQLYEIMFLTGAAAVILRIRERAHREGDQFRAFLILYCAWRLFIDFWKPDLRFAGLSTIQWFCAAALIYYARDAAAMLSRQKVVAHG